MMTPRNTSVGSNHTKSASPPYRRSSPVARRRASDMMEFGRFWRVEPRHPIRFGASARCGRWSVRRSRIVTSLAYLACRPRHRRSASGAGDVNQNAFNYHRVGGSRSIGLSAIPLRATTQPHECNPTKACIRASCPFVARETHLWPLRRYPRDPG